LGLDGNIRLSGHPGAEGKNCKNLKTLIISVIEKGKEAVPCIGKMMGDTIGRMHG
jgi:hypothetical protein